MEGKLGAVEWEDTGRRRSLVARESKEWEGSLMYTECYSTVSWIVIYPTTFNDYPPSTQFQQGAMAQVVGCQHCRDWSSIPSQSMCDLWWAKWYCDRPVSQYFGLPLPTSLYQRCTLIHTFIHPWLPQPNLSNNINIHTKFH
jgi:hypothetical protein